MEMMLDRRLPADDGYGMGEGVSDNVPTRSIFRLLYELHSVRVPLATTSTSKRSDIIETSTVLHVFSVLVNLLK